MNPFLATFAISLCFQTCIHRISAPPSTTVPPDVLDESCKTPANLKELDKFKYEDYQNVSIYTKEKLFPSYIGYPCSTELWKMYHEQFQKPLLRCPFGKDLNPEYKIFTAKFLNLTKNRPLHFQLICLSRQYEACEALDPSPNGTDCLGVCKCMNPMNITNPDHLASSKVEQILENEVRCGVKNGGVCIPAWKYEYDPTNPASSPPCNRNPTLEAAHYQNKKNFYLRCESNAGCHDKKKICECAIGHTCSNSAKKEIVESDYMFDVSVIMIAPILFSILLL